MRIERFRRVSFPISIIVLLLDVLIKAVGRKGEKIGRMGNGGRRRGPAKLGVRVKPRKRKKRKKLLGGKRFKIALFATVIVAGVVLYSVYGVNSRSADTDKDGLGDWLEIETYKTDPLVPDSDADGLEDGEEINYYQTNPLESDTDDDGLLDGLEVTIL